MKASQLNEILDKFINIFKQPKQDIVKQYEEKTGHKCLELNEFYNFVLNNSNLKSLIKGFYEKSQKDRIKLYDKYRETLCKILNQGGFNFIPEGQDLYTDGYGFSVITNDLIVSNSDTPVYYVNGKSYSFTKVQDKIISKPAIFSICHNDTKINAILYLDGFFGVSSVSQEICDYKYEMEVE